MSSSDQVQQQQPSHPDDEEDNAAATAAPAAENESDELMTTTTEVGTEVSASSSSSTTAVRVDEAEAVEEEAGSSSEQQQPAPTSTTTTTTSAKNTKNKTAAAVFAEPAPPNTEGESAAETVSSEEESNRGVSISSTREEEEIEMDGEEKDTGTTIKLNEIDAAKVDVDNKNETTTTSDNIHPSNTSTTEGESQQEEENSNGSVPVDLDAVDDEFAAAEQAILQVQVDSSSSGPNNDNDETTTTPTPPPPPRGGGSNKNKKKSQYHPPAPLIAATENSNSSTANDNDEESNKDKDAGNADDGNDDDDDITSKAAVALAAVAAAAVANNKSPVAAAKEARDLAQSFIQHAANNEDGGGATGTTNTGGGYHTHQSGGAAAIRNRMAGRNTTANTKFITCVPLQTIKTQLRRRSCLEANSSILLDKLGKGDNDSFLNHLLLLEQYRGVAAQEENVGGGGAEGVGSNVDAASTTTTTTTETTNKNASNDAEQGKLACERLESLLKRIEGAYDSLLDMLPDHHHPPQRRKQRGKNNKMMTTKIDEDIDETEPPKDDDDIMDNEEEEEVVDMFEKAVVVPDLLPPCMSPQGDLTVAFFRACMGQEAEDGGDGEDQEKANPNSAPSTSESEQQTSQLESSAVSPPASPKTATSGSHSSSGWSSMFKRHSATSSGSKGFFRKSRNRHGSGSGGSHSNSTETTSGSAKGGTDQLPIGSTSNLRKGEYPVRIEREMLGLTVENVLERTVVRTVVAGGPAKKAGARVGSLIVQVGNVETKHLTHFETIDELRQSNRPLQLVLRQISEDALRSAREEMGRLIKGSGFGMERDSTGHTTAKTTTTTTNSSGGPLIESDLRIDAYTNALRRRFAEKTIRNKKEEALAAVGEKLVWILTLFVIGLEREAARLFSLADALPGQRKQNKTMYHHTAKDYQGAAKSISKVLLDYTSKKIDPEVLAKKKATAMQPPPPPPLPGRRGLRRPMAANPAGSENIAHEKPLLQIGDVLQRTYTFLADPTSPPAALLRGEVIAFLCDVLDIDTEMELSEEEAVSSATAGAGGAGGINDLGSAGSLLKLIVLNCPVMRSPCCEDVDPDVEELRRRFGSSQVSFDSHKLHAGNRFLAVVHRLAASRSTSARIAACSLGPVLWGHLDFPHQLQLRGVITRALHDVEVIVRKSTATVLHEIAELVFDSRSVPWLVLMCERAMTDPEPQLRSAAMTLTWHLAEHLPNAFLGDARQGSRYLRRLPSRDDPLFADVYLLQCKLLPVATRLAEDRSPSVRLAVAAQCDRLCDAMGDHWSSVIIDVLLGLLSDSDERVRCEAVSCVPRLSEIVLMSVSPGESAPSEMSILEALFPAAIKLQKDTCVSVRVALAAAAGELLTLLVAMQTRASDALSHSERKDQEAALGRMYKMHVDDRLIPMVQSLLNDADPEVTSASLRAVTNATRSSVQQSRARMMSVQSVTSTDDDAASMSSYHSHTSRGEKPVFSPVLSESQVLRLLPTLSELADSRQWRVRQSAVEIVPALLGCTTKIETRTEISKLCVRLMGDQVDAVRKTAAECLCMGGSSLGSHGEEAGGEWITSVVIPTIRKCAMDNVFAKQRLLSLKMIEVVLINGVCPNKWYATPPNEKNLTDTPSRELVAIALSLTSDRIANVRLNVGRVLETVLHVFEERELSFIIKVLTEQVDSEQKREGGGDADVLYFANRCTLRAKGIIEERNSADQVHEAINI